MDAAGLIKNEEWEEEGHSGVNIIEASNQIGLMNREFEGYMKWDFFPALYETLFPKRIEFDEWHHVSSNELDSFSRRAILDTCTDIEKKIYSETINHGGKYTEQGFGYRLARWSKNIIESMQLSPKTIKELNKDKIFNNVQIGGELVKLNYFENFHKQQIILNKILKNIQRQLKSPIERPLAKIVYNFDGHMFTQEYHINNLYKFPLWNALIERYRNSESKISNNIIDQLHLLQEGMRSEYEIKNNFSSILEKEKNYFKSNYKSIGYILDSYVNHKPEKLAFEKESWNPDELNITPVQEVLSPLKLWLDNTPIRDDIPTRGILYAPKLWLDDIPIWKIITPLKTWFGKLEKNKIKEKIFNKEGSLNEWVYISIDSVSPIRRSFQERLNDPDEESIALTELKNRPTVTIDKTTGLNAITDEPDIMANYWEDIVEPQVPVSELGDLWYEQENPFDHIDSNVTYIIKVPGLEDGVFMKINTEKNAIEFGKFDTLDTLDTLDTKELKSENKSYPMLHAPDHLDTLRDILPDHAKHENCNL